MSTTNLVVLPTRKIERKKRRKRVRGQGALFLRGRIYWFEVNWKGQRFRESLHTSDPLEAGIKMNEKLRVIHSGELPRTFGSVTVKNLYDAWISEVERTCRASTLRDYRCRWQAHLEPVFGRMLANHVTKDEVSAYLTKRKREGAGEISQNRENRVLQMIYNYNRKKIAANDFPEFPDMHSEKNYVRKGRLSQEDFNTIISRLDDPAMFWLKVIVTMTFKFGFRKRELLDAKVGYFNPQTSMFVLPAFTTKNKMEREVAIKRDGEIYHMLMALSANRGPEEPLFRRGRKAVKDYRKAWLLLTEGMTNGRGGAVKMHDLRRSAITNMSNKGIGAAQAGTHLTAEVFNRYISRSEDEKQATASLIES